ncbi:GL23128 [Drosophila persimilis]|uniref:GL23128 n=1 Tax=Drosophila persimilis TaxID=7234 RepID=B4G5P8_DROPE|nr:GL23128 [Drosophila persimilis]
MPMDVAALWMILMAKRLPLLLPSHSESRHAANNSNSNNNLDHDNDDDNGDEDDDDDDDDDDGDEDDAACLFGLTTEATQTGY